MFMSVAFVCPMAARRMCHAHVPAMRSRRGGSVACLPALVDMRGVGGGQGG